MARSHLTLTLFSILLVLFCLSFTVADAHPIRRHSKRLNRRCKPRSSAAPTLIASHSATPTSSSKPAAHTASNNNGSGSSPSASASNCFPALGFQMPDSVPQDTNNWWCDASTEHAFLGFSYEVSACECTLFAR